LLVYAAGAAAGYSWSSPVVAWSRAKSSSPQLTAGTGSQNPHTRVLNPESCILGARQLCASTLQVGQAANDIAISSAFSSVLRRGRFGSILAASTTGTS